MNKVVLGVLILASALTSSQIAADESVLTIGNVGEPETLDPHRYNLRLEETLLNDLFLGLTTFNRDGEIVPGAATQWHTSENGLTWTFAMRPDLKWSDGTPLTADDFVYSFRRLLDPGTAASLAYFLYMLDNAAEVNAGTLPIESLGVSAPDPATLVLRLARPYPYLLERLLYPTGYPVPKHVIERHGDAWVKPDNWVSNGAYTLEDWQPQAHVSMRANPHFYEPPAIAKVRYLPVPNEQSGYNRFRSNELDVAAGFPSGEIATISRDYASALRTSDLLSMMYLVFNVQKPPFDDVRVRQALSLAIDQEILTDKVLRSGAKPAYSFAPALLSDYDSNKLPHVDLPMDERIATARQLLAQAGFTGDNPLKVTLRHLSGLEAKRVNLAISGMWKRVGINAQLHQADLKTHFSDLRQGDFQVAWAGWVGESNAEHYLGLLQSDIGNVNYGRFKNTVYDKLMQQALNEASFEVRNSILSSAEAVVVHDYPVIPLYTSSVRRLVSPKISGWHENLRDMHQVRYLDWK